MRPSVFLKSFAYALSDESLVMGGSLVSGASLAKDESRIRGESLIIGENLMGASRLFGPQRPTLLNRIPKIRDMVFPKD